MACWEFLVWEVLEVYDLGYGPVFVADLLCDLGNITLVSESQRFSHQCYGGNNICMPGLSQWAVGKNNPNKVWGSPL